MQNTIQLQYVGKVNAKPVQDFKIGEKMMWNYGFTSEIISIVKETPKQIILEMNSVSPEGKKSEGTHRRRMQKTRLAAIA